MAKKILIVEDNDLNLKLFRDLLGANGYSTFETKEGIEAIAMTRNIQPDLIIMDIQLPEISGLDITRKINGEILTGRVLISDPVLAGDTIYVRERLF